MEFGAKSTKQKYIDSNESNAFALFSEAMYQTLKTCRKMENQQIVLVCIGTDRSTGDSLGPIIGYKLRDMKYSDAHVYGDLDTPVHAKNLDEITKYIHQKYNNPFVISIDACLGKTDHVGFITVGSGPLKPGSAVNKDLEPVGDMHITGIVNFSGLMDFLILQNTRLGVVMKMADIIASGVKYVLWRLQREDLVTKAEQPLAERSRYFAREANL